MLTGIWYKQTWHPIKQPTSSISSSINDKASYWAIICLFVGFFSGKLYILHWLPWCMANSKILSTLKFASLKRSQMCLHYSYSNDCFTLRILKTVPCFYRETTVKSQLEIWNIVFWFHNYNSLKREGWVIHKHILVRHHLSPPPDLTDKK